MRRYANQEMNIREANINDAEGIANVHVKAWQSAYREIMPNDYLDSLSVNEKTKIWQKSLSEHSLGINLVIEKNKEIIGFCVFGPARDDDQKNCNVGELVALNILPKYWRNGYGTEMVNYVLSQSDLKGWQALYLWVIKQNKKAIAIYEANGFIREGAEKLNDKLTGYELQEIRYICTLSSGFRLCQQQKKNLKNWL